MTVLMLVVGVAALSGPADAAGGEHGVLRVKGAGYLYAGSRGEVALYASAGATETFGFQVKNTGTEPSQYNLKLTGGSSFSCASCVKPTVAVYAGSLLLTRLAQGPNGYFTAGIDPGKLATYTLKVTLPAGTPPGTSFKYRVYLTDTAGSSLDFISIDANVAKTKGTTDHDQFVSTSGTPATTSPTPWNGTDEAGVITSPSVAIGSTATFTVKLMNNSTTVGPILYWLLVPSAPCDRYKLTVKAGSLDVTQAVIDRTYRTAPLAHGASKNLTMTVKYVAGNTCSSAFGYWQGVATSPDYAGQSRMAMYVNPAATN